MIAVIDYGMGNLGSIIHSLKRIDVSATVTSDPKCVRTARKIILPGVGSFDRGMQNLKNNNLIPSLEEQILDNKVPVLGICLGMQLFSRWSDEGGVEGLGWIEAKTRRFNFCQEKGRLKVPHMGWNAIRPGNHPLLSGITGDDRFYFVHSYHIGEINDEFIIGTTSYGYDFPSVICKDNIMGIQCHPERSHKSGIRILKNFMNLT